MARVTKVVKNSQRIRPHSAESSVECRYQEITDGDGEKLLHLSTFGSKHRASEPKSSQSLQVDRTIGISLVELFCETFGLAAPGDDYEPRLVEAYRANPALFRQLIAEDVTANDVIGWAHRRVQVERFRRLMTDDDAFAEEAAEIPGKGTEKVWQRFFEQNSWILGTSLATQLLTSWSDDRLEQVVAGYSIAEVGKRTDALMRTAGRVRSMVFVEFKTHKTELLREREYRSGVWMPSSELSGAVAQVQSTVHLATKTIHDQLQSKDAEGFYVPDDWTYMLRPRSYVVVGQLGQFLAPSGGHHEQKIRSFELYRRDLTSPEVVTFDELLAKAEWMVSTPFAG
ncbi:MULTISPECIES: Shedu immune nuclease family protein [unclassified Nocardia]|uniref:Shedu immune nuclease family protein n=1 Tax=unclassified Nocardia TaxID=2637762 RepID=UPI0033AC3B7A